MKANFLAKYYPVLSDPYPETTENIDRLFQAVKSQDYSTIEYLLTEKKCFSSTVNYADKSRPSLLIECCRKTDLKLLQLMIKIERTDMKTTYEDAHQHRALWYAIEKKFLDGIRELLGHKLVDPNLHDTKTSFTPVLQAIQTKSSEVIRKQTNR